MKDELPNVMVDSILRDGDVNGDGLWDETPELAFDGAKLTHTQFDTQASRSAKRRGSSNGDTTIGDSVLS